MYESWSLWDLFYQKAVYSGEVQGQWEQDFSPICTAASPIYELLQLTDLLSSRNRKVSEDLFICQYHAAVEAVGRLHMNTDFKYSFQ